MMAVNNSGQDATNDMDENGNHRCDDTEPQEGSHIGERVHERIGIPTRDELGSQGKGEVEEGVGEDDQHLHQQSMVGVVEQRELNQCNDTGCRMLSVVEPSGVIPGVELKGVGID